MRKIRYNFVLALGGEFSFCTCVSPVGFKYFNEASFLDFCYVAAWE